MVHSYQQDILDSDPFLRDLEFKGIELQHMCTLNGNEVRGPSRRLCSLTLSRCNVGQDLIGLSTVLGLTNPRRLYLSWLKYHFSEIQQLVSDEMETSHPVDISSCPLSTNMQSLVIAETSKDFIAFLGCILRIDNVSSVRDLTLLIESSRLTNHAGPYS